MLFDVVPVLLVFVAVAIIVTIVLRRLPDIATIKVETIAEAKSAEAKRQILAQRLGRKLTAMAARFWENTAGARQAVAEQMQKQYKKLLEWERKTKTPAASSAPIGDRAVATLLVDAEDARAQGKTSAEAMYLEVIRMDHRNAKAYFGLAQLYIGNEQYEEARQALEYAARIDHNNPEVFGYMAKLAADDGRLGDAETAFVRAAELEPENIEHRIGLGDIALRQENYQGASEAYESAVTLEPSNPRCLDRLLEACILLGNKRVAVATLKRLTEVNPENHKLLEFQQRIAALSSRSRPK